ncbi:MAG: carbohydrate porin [Burkholderiaceae bacterium]|nr:MAG: carbohydrate porin [Burkholderiaceae bacterium]TBR75558.1 MAG: carbohydrate porin [Burkholderiaceae bacterium]
MQRALVDHGPRRNCGAARECAAPGRFALVRSFAGVALASLALASVPALAGPASVNPDAIADGGPQADQGIQAQPVGQWTGVWTRSSLLGDMGGLRSWMARRGVSLNATEVSEYLYNTRGGLQTGGTYDGLTTITLGVDGQKAFDLPGGLFNASLLQIHGRNLSEYDVGSLNTSSGIEAQDTTRLWELWYQQSFFDQKADIRFGQQSLDQEFMVSSYAGTFVNTMFGWAGLPSYGLPSGGPAYPLSALGVRVKAQFGPSLTALAGVYDGNPLGNNPDNLRGTNFNVHNGALTIAELQYSINKPANSEMVEPGQGGLPGTYKLGFWYNNANPFNDQLYDNTGRSLANPASSRVPLIYTNNYSWYAVADQMVWRPNPEEPRSIGVFARVMGAPGDRNLVSLSANAGVVMAAPFEGRDNDTAGIGLAYIKIGSHAHELALQDAVLTSSGVNGVPYGAAASETALELTYQYQVTPWWVVQGDLQYTLNTGAGLRNPNNPARALGNALVAGVRTTITF